MPPEYWASTAEKVKRQNHQVEIQILSTNDQWYNFYYGNNSVSWATRVLHLYVQQDGNIPVIWHDEPPTCRDKPVWDGQHERNGCLVNSKNFATITRIARYIPKVIAVMAK
jgi:hypothetical protein